MSRRIVLGCARADCPSAALLTSFLEQAGHVVQRLAISAQRTGLEHGLQVARAIAERRADRGIVLDPLGTGVSIVANKVPSVRAAVCRNPEQARSAVEAYGCNVLVLGEESLQSDSALQAIAQAFLEAQPQGGPAARGQDEMRRLEAHDLTTEAEALADRAEPSDVDLVVEEVLRRLGRGSASPGEPGQRGSAGVSGIPYFAKLVTEYDVRRTAERGLGRIRIGPATLITPAARDLAATRQIVFEEEPC